MSEKYSFNQIMEGIASAKDLKDFARAILSGDIEKYGDLAANKISQDAIDNLIGKTAGRFIGAGYRDKAMAMDFGDDISRSHDVNYSDVRDVTAKSLSEIREVYDSLRLWTH
ncbi:hypothetical protein [Phaeobacter inhibens]|uniref:hypothetical protein n=1 Tax=Phaeobacter inhibens TaxID=221822 RepID=UPI0024B6BF9D|nr:hypothetical protein [Phaeobacter inhibens]WHP70249.1 hypothetical protein QMZ01_08785 [Phaeobacter inhibens]